VEKRKIQHGEHSQTRTKRNEGKGEKKEKGKKVGKKREEGRREEKTKKEEMKKKRMERLNTCRLSV
jgi:hypothetical protein